MTITLYHINCELNVTQPEQTFTKRIERKECL
jgi:hypothetical protein